MCLYLLINWLINNFAKIFFFKIWMMFKLTTGLLINMILTDFKYYPNNGYFDVFYFDEIIMLI